MRKADASKVFANEKAEESSAKTKAISTTESLAASEAQDGEITDAGFTTVS